MPHAVLDSNALIYHVGGFQHISDLEMNRYAISAATVFEILRFPGLSEKEEAHLLLTIKFCEVIPITESIALRAASLNRIRPRGRAMDLLIAATALELSLPLITGNTKDFKHIPGLEVRTGV